MNDVKIKVSTIRLRTWSLTLAIVMALALYLFVQVGWNEEINWIDFILLGTIQVITHCIYFPDGELYGTSGVAFQSNKKAYNTKATSINDNRKVVELREYCDYDYEERCREYRKTVCGAIGITADEYEELSKKSPKEIRKLGKFEYEGRVVYFTRKSRKELYKLLFCKLPVEKNHPDTILSAIDKNGTSAIRDGSTAFRTKQYIARFMKAFVVGLFLAYIAYEAKDGIGIADVARALTCLVSMFTTAVMAYSKGETCTEVYKNQFYIELSNFIDSFFEWLLTEKNYEITQNKESE